MIVMAIAVIVMGVRVPGFIDETIRTCVSDLWSELMDKVFNKAVRTVEYLNESILEVTRDDFKDVCLYLSDEKHALLRLMFATDERERDGLFRVTVVFTVPGMDRFFLVVLPVKESDPRFPSLTPHHPRCPLVRARDHGYVRPHPARPSGPAQTCFP